MKRKWKLFIKRKKENNRGVTLIEALVATVILALAVVPLMNSLVTSAKINAKARIQQENTTLCQTIMEQVKAQTLREMYLEMWDVKNDPSVVTMDFASHAVTSAQVDMNCPRYTNAWYGSKEHETVSSEVYRGIVEHYKLYFDNIEGYYVLIDATVDNTTNHDASSPIGYKSYTDHGLAQYIQYNVTISLYKSDADRNAGTNVVATYSGSARDFTMIKYTDPNTP
jgi:type II secretory pathway pseudopilin PulG